MITRIPRRTNYSDLWHLWTGKWDSQRATKGKFWPSSSMIEEVFWFCSCQITRMVALKTQFHRLTSLLEILASLQSPKEMQLKMGKKIMKYNVVSLPKALKWKGNEERNAAVSGLPPQNMHGDVAWIPLFTRLSAVRKWSWRATYEPLSWAELVKSKSIGSNYALHGNQWCFYRKSWRWRDHYHHVWSSILEHLWRWWRGSSVEIDKKVVEIVREILKWPSLKLGGPNPSSIKEASFGTCQCRRIHDKLK